MEAKAFLDYLRGALDTTWKVVDNSPKKPSEYSAYIFAALAAAARTAGMEPRWHDEGPQLLFDMVWLPQNGGAYRLPQVVIEHENGLSEDHFIYDLRKILMAWAPLRVMIGYVATDHNPRERLTTIQEAAAHGHWVYPDGCADLILVGPYWLQTPRDYLVLYRPAHAQTFVELGVLDSVALPAAPQSPRQLLDAALAWLLAANHRPAPLYERDVVSQVQQHIERAIQQGNLPYRVYSEYRLHHNAGSDPNSYPTDLVILYEENAVDRPALAVEFKFSPDPQRFPEAFRRTKFPVLSRKEVATDIDKVARYVNDGQADEAVAVIIDEGGTFRQSCGDAIVDAAARHNILAAWVDYPRDPICAVLVVEAVAK